MSLLSQVAFAAAGVAVTFTIHGCGGGLGCATDGSDYEYKESVSGNVRTITTNHCPNHPFDSSYNPNRPVLESTAYTVPVKPMINTKDTDLTEQGGGVGVFFNGALSFSPYGGPRYGKTTNQATSAAKVEGDTFDMCNCHSSQDNMPSYHCHVTPSCLMLQLDPNNTEAAHSPMLGWAADGFPLYGPRGPGGILMKRCSVVNNQQPCVDECGGRAATDPDDGFTYRYYHLGKVNDGKQCGGPADSISPWVFNTEDMAFYPNSPVCYKGCCPSGTTCSFRFVPDCESGAATGTTRDVAAQHATGLPKNEDACWKDSKNLMVESVGDSSDKSAIYLAAGVTGVALIVLTAVVVMVAMKPSRRAHQKMEDETEMQAEAEAGNGLDSVAQAS